MLRDIGMTVEEVWKQDEACKQRQGWWHKKQGAVQKQMQRMIMQTTITP